MRIKSEEQGDFGILAKCKSIVNEIITAGNKRGVPPKTFQNGNHF